MVSAGFLTVRIGCKKGWCYSESCGSNSKLKPFPCSLIQSVYSGLMKLQHSYSGVVSIATPRSLGPNAGKDAKQGRTRSREGLKVSDVIGDVGGVSGLEGVSSVRAEAAKRLVSTLCVFSVKRFDKLILIKEIVANSLSYKRNNTRHC